MAVGSGSIFCVSRFSALQRAEIAEMEFYCRQIPIKRSFSALQRAEIAEIKSAESGEYPEGGVSVLFNEPKLLKFSVIVATGWYYVPFQCSSTSRNC